MIEVFEYQQIRRSVMPAILAEILSLAQHIATLAQKPESYQPMHCAYCGKGIPHKHGHYPRKANRDSSSPKDPILIPRFFCQHCRKTFSVLPECIPPRRWYLWAVQQALLVKCLVGTSLRKVSASGTPSHSTCRRWIQRFKDQFLQHRSAILQTLPSLGTCIETLQTFWQATLEHVSLAKAMLLCHKAGVIIP
jgi:transposase-like protein